MKNSKIKYLKLYSCCILVKGHSRSLIIDTQRSDFYAIPNDLYDILSEKPHVTCQELYDCYGEPNQKVIDEYINFLMEKELIFITDEPDSFPAINYDWETPRTITNAILDINESSSYDLMKAVREIDKLGAESLQIRVFTIKPNSWFDHMLTQITTNSLRLRNIELIIKYNDENPEELEEKLAGFQLVSYAIIHSSKFSAIKSESNCNTPIIYTEEIINDSNHCGVIKPTYFSSNIDQVLEAMNFNSCLNRKIAIDVNGRIKNCPSMQDSFGHIDSTSLVDVIGDSTFRHTWTINKSQINVCKDCEFRLVCSDCRAYLNNIHEKPAKCGYNPYTAKWESVN